MTSNLIGYVTLGSNDLARSTAFYDAVFAEVGIPQLMQNERMVMWGKEMASAALAVCTPFDGKPAAGGNGVMVALRMEDRSAVNRLHAKAMELGASDEGAPGPRGTGGFYGGYFRDLDGNKLCGFCIGAT